MMFFSTFSGEVQGLKNRPLTFRHNQAACTTFRIKAHMPFTMAVMALPLPQHESSARVLPDDSS